MKLLKRITDKEILGTNGLSTAKPRLTARAILKHGDQFAVMYAEKFDLYSLWRRCGGRREPSGCLKAGGHGRNRLLL